MNFGYEFNNNLSVSIKPETVTQIKERCRDFLVLLCSELQKRIPENIEMLEKIFTFSPQSASSLIKADIIEIASKLKKKCMY